jgi:hypothetical protein
MKKQTNRNKLERPDWKDYELQILKVYREKYPNQLVLGDHKIKGRHSKRARQLDVVVYKKDDTGIDCIIECKNLAKVVTIPVLDSFYGKLHDLGIKKGVIITTKGFSDGTKEYAKKKKIELKKIDYEYLKDYCYIPPSDVPDVFMKATRYTSPYCSTCDITSVYEIGEVYGMAEHEPLYCPKCKTQLAEVRSDANHRVIKIFHGNNIEENEIEKVISKHINITKEEWMSNFFLLGFPSLTNDCCFICKHEFCEHPPTHSKTDYKGKDICSECFMSKRTLLIDHNYI